MRRFGKRMMEGSFGAGILKGRRGWIGVPGVVHVTEQRDIYEFCCGHRYCEQRQLIAIYK
ncbi:hypothetical protein DXA12_05915 [Ruminococcus sp. AM57-5]|nr:hypothetical protein DXA12_05915 [Ruminococcus sp. AM57-5]